MISLEQVQLLEEKVSKAIEYVKRVTEENTVLAGEKAALIQKLETNQKRIDELEVLVLRFKEDQGRIEDGVIAALDRLSQFEEAFENTLKEPALGKTGRIGKTDKPAAAVPKETESEEVFFEISENSSTENSEELDIF